MIFEWNIKICTLPVASSKTQSDLAFQPSWSHVHLFHWISLVCQCVSLGHLGTQIIQIVQYTVSVWFKDISLQEKSWIPEFYFLNSDFFQRILASSVLFLPRYIIGRTLARSLKLPIIFERVPVKKKLMLPEVERAAAREPSRVGSRGPFGPLVGSSGNGLAGVQGAVPWKLWGFTYFECLRRALLGLYKHLSICIFMIKKRHRLLGENYAWIRNKLIVLRGTTRYFCLILYWT